MLPIHVNYASRSQGTDVSSKVNDLFVIVKIS